MRDFLCNVIMSVSTELALFFSAGVRPALCSLLAFTCLIAYSALSTVFSRKSELCFRLSGSALCFCLWRSYFSASRLREIVPSGVDSLSELSGVVRRDVFEESLSIFSSSGAGRSGALVRGLLLDVDVGWGPEVVGSGLRYDRPHRSPEAVLEEAAADNCF